MAFPFHGCSSLLLFSSDAASGPGANFLYNAGADVDSSVLLWTKSSKTLLTPKMNERQARALFKGRVVPIGPGQLAPTIKRLAPRGKIGLDFESLTASRHLTLAKLLGGQKRFVDVSEKLESMRSVKKKEEISRICKAVSISKNILSSLHLSSSMTELDVVRQLAGECLKRDVSFAYPPIVAAGAASSQPHHTPAARRLGHGVVLIDFGVKYKNYCADLSRCYFLGPAKEERARYEEAKKVFHSIVDSMPSCRTAGELVRMGDKEMKKAGWPQLIHAPGHGIGLEVHEDPHLYSKSNERLRPGMVMALEPAFYCPRFGVRYENEVVWGKKKAKVL